MDQAVKILAWSLFNFPIRIDQVANPCIHEYT
jgi:hypothetical protein